MWRVTGVCVAALWLAGALWAGGTAAGSALDPPDYRQRPAGQEIIYFLLPDRFDNADPTNDRGGASGEREVTGYDPADPGFYHGGDLRGITRRLDYIQSLGATALWLAPVFKNKTVQGGPHASAGYHGYWITDFTRIDPHFGSAEDFRDLVNAAHARGMKVYLDIVVNHTADVIQYRECESKACPYRSRADYPYTRRGGIDGEPINAGFLGDGAGYQTAENFAHLTRPDYAYTPFVPVGMEHAKVPDWLNDLLYYHNRGNSDFRGESALSGDFGGLDDVFTEKQRVVRGFIDIYADWIERIGIDGYRIDTAKHVNPEFWQQFVPAIRSRAAAHGIPNFHIFGEVSLQDFDPGQLARHTRIDGLPAVLDFGFALAVRDTVAGRVGTDRLAELFADDVLYEGGAATARQLPTFISNHDDGRFGWFVRRAYPHDDDAEVLARMTLGYAMLLTLRGVPVIYYGDEQGFAGTGGDRLSREDMFASHAPAYLQERLIGTSATLASDSFRTEHPLLRRIRELAHLRQTHDALREGEQITRFASHAPGLFAVSRLDPTTGAEILVAFNTATTPIDAQVEVDPRSHAFRALHGACADAISAVGSYRIRLAPLDFVVCAAQAAP